MPFLLFVTFSKTPFLGSFPTRKRTCNRFGEGPNFINTQLLPRGGRDSKESCAKQGRKKEQRRARCRSVSVGSSKHLLTTRGLVHSETYPPTVFHLPYRLPTENLFPDPPMPHVRLFSSNFHHRSRKETLHVDSEGGITGSFLWPT